MNNRLLAGLIGVIALLIISGCLGLGGTVSDSAAAENATYDWDRDVDAAIDLYDDEYTAVFRLDNSSELRVYQSTRYGTEHPVGVRAVQFKYPNGTIVDSEHIDISETRSSVYLDVPEENGKVAFTASKQSKQFSIPSLVEGTWEVSVPPDHRVDNLVLGTVRPRGYSTEMRGDRVHVIWSDVSGSTVRVDYYLARDIYLFGGLIVVVLVAGAIGIGYVYRQILELRREREELGLDLDVEDDGRDPPPGLR